MCEKENSFKSIIVKYYKSTTKMSRQTNQKQYKTRIVKKVVEPNKIDLLDDGYVLI